MKLPLLGCCALLPFAVAAQTLERIEKSGSFTIAHRESSVPFSYLLPNQAEPVGLAVELCKRVAEAVQRELKLKSLKIRYLPVTSSTRIPAIVEGKADIECGTTTDNKERREQVSFSHHHFFGAIQILARSSTGIQSWSDLDGRRVVFSKGTSTQGVLAKDARTASLSYTTLEAKDHAESFEWLSAGKADAFVLEDVQLAGMRASAAKPADFALVGQRLTIEPYALMMAKGDVRFQRLVNRELEQIYRSGEYAKLYKRWFESPIPPKQINFDLPMSNLLRGQVRRPSSILPG